MVILLSGQSNGTSIATLALDKTRYRQLGYVVTSKPTAKGRMVVIRPK